MKRPMIGVIVSGGVIPPDENIIGINTRNRSSIAWDIARAPTAMARPMQTVTNG